MEKVEDKSYGCIPIYKDNGSILFGLVQHDDGYYNFPKGHPEEEESIEETIKREALEEAQLKNLKLDMSKVFTNSYIFIKENKEVHKSVSFYIAYTNEMPEKASVGFTDEIINVVWLPKEEALEKLTYDASKNILKQVCEYLGI